jgi:hypothetical protein
MFSALKSYLYAFIAALAAAVVSVIYAKGRKDADNDNHIDDFNEYINTRKRMDETDGPSDADVQRWLHERGKYKRNL